MKYLLIDGNNLAIRAAFGNGELRNSSGISTGVHYGVFQSLIGLKNRFQDYDLLMVWDGKSARRISEANDGVDKGLIRSGYKQNRPPRDQQRPEMVDFHEQAPYLQKAIGALGIPQIRLLDFEADDVIAAYSKKLRDDHDIILVTSDKDYYQLLHENVKMWDGKGQKMTVKSEWESENGITPEMHVDCGALSGDTGDNIFGIPSWGEKTALKAIQKFRNWKAVLDDLHKSFDPIRDIHPDLEGDDFKKLVDIETPSGKPKYPEIWEKQPFSGVALAMEEKKWKPTKELKKGVKANILALMFEERVELAYSLKKMDDEIPNLPEFSSQPMNKERLSEYFDYYDIQTLKDDLWLFE